MRLSGSETYKAACAAFRRKPRLTDKECAEKIGVEVDELSERVIQPARSRTERPVDLKGREASVRLAGFLRAESV